MMKADQEAAIKAFGAVLQEVSFQPKPRQAARTVQEAPHPPMPTANPDAAGSSTGDQSTETLPPPTKGKSP
jgi:hypothetical protein